MGSQGSHSEPHDRTESSLHWHGFDSLRYLVIFGDSYSAIHGVVPMKTLPDATDEKPLGIEWPGIGWAEPGSPIWVAHLVASTQKQNKQPPLLVYDYAMGGDTVRGLAIQARKRFLPGLASKPAAAPWTADDTLFVFWVGINDCATIIESMIPDRLEELMDIAKDVYRAGGRNFLFINLPPIERTATVGRRLRNPEAGKKYALWNRLLSKSIDAFELKHPYSTVFEFSSHDTFTRILDDPAQFGFKKEGKSARGGGIWVDHLHPTSAVHAVLAREIEEFLRKQPRNYATETPPLENEEPQP